jgi:predicted ATPase/class 3 adenylate cyclase
MFCDLVGSTALSARLDPEDLRELIGAYHANVAETAGRHDGFVAKYMGDGVLLYFGYPEAQEDDAERAVRAGLAIVDAIGRLPAPERLQVHVGIATGVVVVGDLVGAGESQERGIIGETPNLAARLQAIAEPDTVVIGPTTRHLLGDLFEYKELGPIAVKGFAAPVQACRVLRPSAFDSRFEALHAFALTPLVGRQDELELLLRCWKQAKAGAGQVMLLSGEPGIGKSRILATLLELLHGEPHSLIRYFCSPHHQDSALYPFIRQLEHAAGFERDDASTAKFDKLTSLLNTIGVPTADVPVLVDLLSLPNLGGDAAWRGFSPQQKKERSFAAVAHQVESQAGQAPVLLLVEDVHWADPSSRELLDLIVARVADLPVLAVMTFRSGFQPSWVDSQYVTSLMLSRFSADEGAALVDRVLAGKGSSLASGLVAEIVGRADGIPLFLEELTKAVLEADQTKAAVAEAARGPEGPVIPATLHASLTARLDRLGAAAKEVGQIGAALGREFTRELIHAIAPMTDKVLDEQLDRLVSSELIYQRGAPPDAVFTFKHSLVQDAAYSTLLRADKQQLHARIAEALEERFPERGAREPELLAHHFAEAHQIERALDYMLKAGERAVERSANVEAIRHLTRGLAAISTLPETSDRDRRELAFQIAIGTPLIAVHGYAAPETGAAYNRARVLCERLGEAEPLVATLSGEFVFHFVRGNYPMMRRLTDEAQSIVQRLPHPMVRLASHRLAGITAMHSGAFPAACSEFEAIIGSYDARQHRSQPVHYVHDPMVSALTYLAPVLWIAGYPDQARRASIAAFECAAELNQANLTAHVHNFAGAGLDELLGNVAGVRAHAEVILELAERHSLHYWRLNALILQGWAMVQEGAVDSGIALMQQSAADRAALGVAWYQSRYLLMLATAHAQSGQAEAGLRAIAQADDLVARTSELMWTAELKRVAGELRRIQGESTILIETFFEQALSIARKQGAKSFELRAARSLARLRRDQGRRDEARYLLTPIFGWFSEGFDTPDFTEARLLLEDL